MNRKKIMYSVLGLVVVVALCAVPLLTMEGEFSGADSLANDAIATIDANYTPWFAPLWEPPGSETESLLFALQAALGSGVFFFGMGYFAGSKKSKKADNDLKKCK